MQSCPLWEHDSQLLKFLGGKDWLLKVFQTHIHRKGKGQGCPIVPDGYLFLEHTDGAVKLGLLPQCAFQDETSVSRDNFKKSNCF